MSRNGTSKLLRVRALGALSVLLALVSPVLGGAMPASASPDSHDSELVKFIMPDGTVEYVDASERAGSSTAVGPLAGFDWEADYSWRILSREWTDTGGTTTITVYPISNCGTYGYQYLYLARKIIGGYQSVGDGRIISCANQSVNVWTGVPNDTFIFMLQDPEGQGGSVHSTHGRVAY